MHGLMEGISNLYCHHHQSAACLTTDP